MMTNALNTYLLDLAERAGKSAVQAAILAIGVTNASHFNVISVNWLQVGEFSAGAAILSILTSLVSAPVNTNGTASLVSSIVSAPKITPKKGNTMAPVADDGKTEYTTYEGIPGGFTAEPVEAAPAEAAPAEPVPAPVVVEPAAPAVEPTPVDVSEVVQENADGSVTINGVTYHK